MSDTLDKWNRIYQNATAPNSPCQALLDNQHLLKASGSALELACGLGGNALHLAKMGLTVSAYDISTMAIKQLQRFAKEHHLCVEAKAADLSQLQLSQNAFDVVVVSAFLDRSLCPAISAALKPDGLLIYQTYTKFKISPGGPSSPDYLLDEGELLQLFADLKPRVYREEVDCGDLEQGLRSQAYLIAQKP